MRRLNSAKKMPDADFTSTSGMNAFESAFRGPPISFLVKAKEVPPNTLLTRPYSDRRLYL